MNILSFLIICVCFVSISFSNVTTGELEALDDLYNQCDGVQWVNQTNWMSGDPCTNLWYGVLCTNGHVTALQLSFNGLYGTLPQTLSNLYSLETLILDDNEISGTIPDSLNQIKSLGKIDLHSNFLGSAIPDSLGDLLDYNLEYLDLSDNKLTGEIPSFFENPPSYFFANLSNNLFTCPIPAWASYTSANCIQWYVSAVDPICTFPNEDINLYGQNFVEEGDGLYCSLYNSTTNEYISATIAKVVSDSHIICSANFTFKICDGTPGHQTFATFLLKLTLNGEVITGNSTLQVNLINYACKFGESISNPGVSGSTFIVPSLGDVYSFCPLGNPTPYQCPDNYQSSSGSYAPSVFNENCSNNNSACYWAPPYYSTTQPSCPFYYCYSSTCVVSGYCPSSACFSKKSDCNSQTSCTK